MKNIKLGLQLYSVREYFEKDYEKTLKEVADMGYEAVEFAGLYDVNPEDVRKLCQELNIVPISAHQGIEIKNNDFDSLLSNYGKIGCKYVAIPWVDSSWLPGRECWNEFSEQIGKMSAEAKKRGMKLCYHNHDFEFEKTEGKVLLDLLYDIIPEDVLKTELDLCWISVAGYSPVEYLEKYSERSEIVHIKDYYIEKKDSDRSKSGFEFRSVGKGLLDTEAVLKTIKHTSCRWLIVEQDAPTPGQTAMDCVASSIEFLKSKIQIRR